MDVYITAAAISCRPEPDETAQNTATHISGGLYGCQEWFAIPDQNRCAPCITTLCRGTRQILKNCCFALSSSSGKIHISRQLARKPKFPRPADERTIV